MYLRDPGVGRRLLPEHKLVCIRKAPTSCMRECNMHGAYLQQRPHAASRCWARACQCMTPRKQASSPPPRPPQRPWRSRPPPCPSPGWQVSPREHGASRQQHRGPHRRCATLCASARWALPPRHPPPAHACAAWAAEVTVLDPCHFWTGAALRAGLGKHTLGIGEHRLLLDLRAAARQPLLLHVVLHSAPTCM